MSAQPGSTGTAAGRAPGAFIQADPAAWAAYTAWLKMTPYPLAVTVPKCQRQIVALIADGLIEVRS